MSWINRESQNGNSDREKDYPFARWMSWLVFVASTLLLIYTYYRAEITFQGGKQSFYFKYYFVSLTGILFWGVVLRLREGIRANIVTLVTSLIVGIYMVEGGLTFLGVGQSYHVTSANTAAALGVEYDQRTKLEVVENLIAEGVDAVLTVQPRIVLTMDGSRLFPFGGISNKTTVDDNESGQRMIYISDRHGFNNPDNQWDSKNLVWLLTGDSFTRGVAVQPGQEIAGQLRSITGNSAISLGSSGNGPLTEYAVLVEYGMALTPAKVLWIYYEGNDLKGDLQREKLNPLLMLYMQDGFSQNLINRQKEIDSSLEEYILEAQMQELLHKTRWIRLYAIRSIIDLDVDFDVDFASPLFTKILTKAKERVESWGGELYFVYLPEYGRYNNKTISHDKFRKKAEVIELVRGLNIPVVDIHQEVFVDHSDPLALFPFGLRGHYIVEGYGRVAKAIVENINR